MRISIILVLLFLSAVSAWADSLVGEFRGSFLENPGLHGRFTVGAIQIELATRQKPHIDNNIITSTFDSGHIRIPGQRTPYKIIRPGRECRASRCATAFLTFTIEKPISTVSSNVGQPLLVTTITYPIHATGEIDFPDRPALLLDGWGTAIENIEQRIE